MTNTSEVLQMSFLTCFTIYKWSNASQEVGPNLRKHKHHYVTNATMAKDRLVNIN